MIEAWDGELRVIIWGDINQEDPTHIISLEGARISERNDNDNETSKCVYVESETSKRKKRVQIKAWRAERVKEYAKLIQQGKRIFEPDKD